MTDEGRDQLKLHHLAPPPGARKAKVRVGRGEGGRRGKTAGRGTKGLKARNKLRPGFEGGQMPLVRRLPHLKGFKRPGKQVYSVVNVGRLGELASGSSVGPDELRAMGVVKHRGRVKVLGEGELDRALTVRAHAFSAAAVAKIEAAGGTVELVAE